MVKRYICLLCAAISFLFYLQPLTLALAEDQGVPEAPAKAHDAEAEGYSEKEAVQYQKAGVKDINCDLGMLYRQLDGKAQIIVSAIGTGKGGDFRRWEVADIKLNIDGESIRPSSSEKFYKDKESFLRMPAAVVFAVIGSQYESCAGSAASGAVCPVTGRPPGSTEGQEKGPVGKGIDKAGMAAGMGLLTAQSKGEITGLRCVFEISQALAEAIDGVKDKIRIILENNSTRKQEKIDVDISADFKKFVKSHPGAEHKAGVDKGGTFIIVAPEEEGGPSNAQSKGSSK